MEIKKISISEINPASYNPRKDLKPNDLDYKKIEASLDEFGLVDPLVYNPKTKNLIGGHQRLKIIISKGMKEVWVSMVPLSLEREKMLNVALNGAHGDWEKDQLAALLEEFTKVPDFDIKATGFSPLEINQLIERYLKKPDEDNFDLKKALEAIETPITKRGDRLILGKHVLVCGDSLDSKDVALLMGEYKGDLFLTDPPYRVKYLSKQSSRKSPKWGMIYKDDLSQAEYEKWLRQILINIEPYLLPGAPFYIWNGFAQFPHMLRTLENLNFKISCIITWVKETFVLNFGDYHQGGEFALYGWKYNKKGGHPWYGGADQSTIWQIHRVPTANYSHPTEKPIELFARSIRNSSKQEDIVVDLFAGSGTAILASELLQRRCLAMEAEPKYCDVIARRFIVYAGEDKVSADIFKRYMKED